MCVWFYGQNHLLLLVETASLAHFLLPFQQLIGASTWSLWHNFTSGALATWWILCHLIKYTLKLNRQTLEPVQRWQEVKPISASPSSSLVLLLLLASIQQNYCPSYFRASVLPVTALVFCWQSLIFVKCLCLFLCSVNKAMHLLTQKFHVIVVDGTLPE